MSDCGNFYEKIIQILQSVLLMKVVEWYTYTMDKKETPMDP